MFLYELAELLGAEVKGERNIPVSGVGDLCNAESTDIIYVLTRHNLEKAKETKASAFIIKAELSELADRPALIVKDPKLAFLKCLEIYYPKEVFEPVISKSAFINETARIGKNVTIMPNSVIMKDALIEDDVIIYPNVVIEPSATISRGTRIYPNAVIGERCIIGENNIIYAGAVIGSDGFGYHDAEGKRYKIPQVGIVRTGKRVEIGAGTTIDRATLGETFIDDDTKIDNLCQIAHNCRLGKRCYLSAQVGLAGSCNVGDDVIMAGQVGLADHINIGNKVVILAQSGVPNDVKDGEQIFGYPARPIRESHRINAALSHLPELIKKIAGLEKELNKSSESET